MPEPLHRVPSVIMTTENGVTTLTLTAHTGATNTAIARKLVARTSPEPWVPPEPESDDDP
jgi:hypothetical protein